MANFTSGPLELKVGDIVVERSKWEENATKYFPLHPYDQIEYFWVIYKIEDKPGYGGIFKGYYAFLLSEPENIIGPVVFRNGDAWEYEVLKHG